MRTCWVKPLIRPSVGGRDNISQEDRPVVAPGYRNRLAPIRSSLLYSPDGTRLIMTKISVGLTSLCDQQ